MALEDRSQPGSDEEPRASAASTPNEGVSEDDAPSLFDFDSELDYLPRPPKPRPRNRPRTLSGWFVGIVVGVLIGLWWFPEVRYTLSAQLQLALAQDRVAWVRVMDSRRMAMEKPHLDAAAAVAPTDYLMQVGRATALIESGGAYNPPASILDANGDVNDHSLLRLAMVARDFSYLRGAYAHLARYLMLSRIRIQRQELTAPSPLDAPSAPQSASANADPTTRSVPPRHKDLQWMEWALHSGEARDPDNAFWPAMLAITDFAALRDDEALHALDRAAHKQNWDAYIYEEVLGQWRLYSAAYGDIGATQKIGPLSLIAFPHLRELRRMAELARWHAERAAAEGRDRDALRIRHNISRLGETIRDTTQWAIEALYGTDLFLIANTDGGPQQIESAIQNADQWEQQAGDFLELLRREHHENEINWLRQEVSANCALRQRVDIARFDASYPGTPPGIPLVALFGNWMVGIFLIQQMVTLSLAALLLQLWQRQTGRPRSPLARLAGLCLIAGLTATAWIYLLTVEASTRAAFGLLCGLLLLAIFGLNGLYRLFLHRSAPLTPDELLSARKQAEARWRGDTTAALLCALLLPGLAALYLLRPALSGLHPVAILLTSLIGTPRPLTPAGAIGIAFLGCALPLAFCLVAGVWALFQRLPPLTGIYVGLRRTVLPALACLAFAYLLMLTRTLRLDSATSRAINEAAQNERQWVLTHSASDSFP